MHVIVLQLEGATATRTTQPAALGEGPRIYVGGVPEELTEDDLSGHFGKWGAVVDIYFPGKKGQKRVNYCFVTFDSWKAAQRACNESERSICGQVGPDQVMIFCACCLSVQMCRSKTGLPASGRGSCPLPKLRLAVTLSRHPSPVWGAPRQLKPHAQGLKSCIAVWSRALASHLHGRTAAPTVNTTQECLMDPAPSAELGQG